jgi:hypothetical protein
MQSLFKTYAESNPKFSGAPIRIQAQANLRQRIFLWRISNTTREIVAWDYGILPEYPWTQDLANFYALAEAARHIKAALPSARVTMTNLCSLPPRIERAGVEVRWAA